MFEDGSTLPVLLGGDGEGGDDGEGFNDAEDDEDDGQVGWEEDRTAGPSKGSRDRAFRQAAKHRIREREARAERDAAIRERDEVRAELETLKVGGPSAWRDRLVHTELASFIGETAHDLSAVAKLLDPSKITVEADGTVNGVDREVERLRESSPFLWKPEDDPSTNGERNPFGQPRRTGRPINVANKVSKTTASKTALQNKYPALRPGR